MKYTEEQLNKCGISFLREYARQLGGAPKLMNKRELIGYILDIQSNNIVPKRNNSGRKPLGNGGLNYGLAGAASQQFGEDDDVALKREPQSDTIKGYFERVESGIGVIGDKTATAFVPRALIDRYSLKSGDFIVGRWERGRNGALIVTSIDEINGGKPEGVLSRANFDRARAEYPSERISFAKAGAVGKAIDLFCPIGKGQRVIMKFRAGDDEIAATEKIVGIFGGKGIRTVACYLNARPEDKQYLEDLCDEATCTGFESDGEANAKAVLKALDRAKTIAENGEDAAIILATLESMKDALGEAFDKSVKAAFSVAKSTRECKSVTLIAMTFSDELLKRYEPIANCIVSVEGKTLDVSASYTRRAALMLGERERAVYEKSKEFTGGDLSQKVKAVLTEAKDGEELAEAEKLF